MSFPFPKAACAVALLAAGLAGCASMHPIGDSGTNSHAAVASLAQFRTSQGLKPMSADPALDRMALQQARYMASAQEMDHTTGFGRDFVTRLRESGIRGAAAENVAGNAKDVNRAIELWKNSPPHRANMLNPRFSRFGLAFATDSAGRRYWAMDLGE